MWKTHKRYTLQLYIYNKIHLYGIDGFAPVKKKFTWSIVTVEMIAHYEDIKRNTLFSQLINLKQKGLVGEHIEDFQKLNIRVTDIPEEHGIDLFRGTLKDNIQHD